jgi:hypothetical protein
MTNAEKVAEAQGLKAQKGFTEAAREIRVATEFENEAQLQKPNFDPDLIRVLQRAAKPTVEDA